MNDWTAGYVADIGYTYGYYAELNPLRTRIPFIFKGLACPEYADACELGFGQGVSINFHAAGTDTNWYGSDFNPAQAAFAEELAKVCGNNADVSDESFLDFCSRDDLPDFDYIGLHGIWSWISDENRNILVEFIGRKLRVGGVLYISYNTMPGWASFAPLRGLMRDHTETMGSADKGIVNRIDDALEFANNLLETNPSFLRANPQVQERLNSLTKQNRSYLAHEYFNKDWHPMPFAKMAEFLEPVKLQYACSANLLDHIDALHLTVEQQEFLSSLSEGTFKESVRDFMINQQFRRDYWVKGNRPISELEKRELQLKERVVLISNRSKIKLKVQGALGELEMTPGIYNPILDYLEDHTPRTIGEIEKAVLPTGVNHGQIFQAIIILIGNGHLASCFDDKHAKTQKPKTRKLNLHLYNKARSSGDIAFISSPLTGGGLSVDRFQQLFLLAMESGLKESKELAHFAWQILKVQNQKIVKEGTTLETDEDNIAELNERAQEFIQLNLPSFKILQII